MLLPDFLETAKPATLFPVLKASEQEGRATSILLSVLRLVPPFTEQILGACGAPIGKRTKIRCFTEVVPKKQLDNSGSSRRAKGQAAGKLRPDGLIVCESQSRTWTAFVETKVAGNYLDEGQVKAYLQLAALNGVDAVITISSELTIHPTQNPAVTARDVPKAVGLFHFSWLSLVTYASVLKNRRAVADLEQRLVMKDLRKFITSEESKLIGAMTMSNAWTEVVKGFHEQINISSSSSLLQDVAEDWLELERYVELSFCSFLGEEVRINRDRKLLTDSSAYRRSVEDSLKSNKQLHLELTVPNAAGPLALTVDLYAKSLLISMRVDLKQDCRPKTSVTWLLNQLKDLKLPESLLLKGFTPRFRSSCDAKYSDAVEEPALLLSDPTLNPRSIEIVYSSPDAIRMIVKPKQFAEYVRFELEQFYQELGQHLIKYVPPAPKPVVGKEVRGSSEDADNSSTVSAAEEIETFDSLPAQNRFQGVRLWPFSRQ